MPVPALADVVGESWLTVRAVLARDTAWARSGHEVAVGQCQVTAALPRSSRGGSLDRTLFDEHTGLLTRVGAMRVDGPRLDLWRAPTDNDHGTFGPPVEVGWRLVGLDRLTHRVVDQQWTPDGFVLRTRVGPAATDIGMRTAYHWTVDGDALVLRVDVEPEGDWSRGLPRLGLRMALPADIDDVEWFGGGPGEAYADSAQATVIGRYRFSVDDMQTPYVFPQENGNRLGVRWAELRGPSNGLRIEGDPTISLTVRRWTSEDLDAARHTTDLVPRDRVFVNLDLAQTGLGTASCGPGVLPPYELHAAPATWTVRLIPLMP